MYKYELSKDTELKIANFLYQISDWAIIRDDNYLAYQLKFFLEIVNEKEILNCIETLRMPIFSHFILSETDINSAFNVLILMENKFHLMPDILFSTELNEEFSDHFSELLNEKIEDEIESLRDTVYDEWYVEEKHRELIEVREKLSLMGLNIVSDFSEFVDYDWHQIGAENYFRDQMQKDD